MTRLGVCISKRMLQTRPLYRENLVKENLELVEDMQSFGRSLGRGGSIGLGPLPNGCGGEMGEEHWMLTKARAYPLSKLNISVFANMPNITSCLLAEADLGRSAWIMKTES